MTANDAAGVDNADDDDDDNVNDDDDDDVNDDSDGDDAGIAGGMMTLRLGESALSGLSLAVICRPLSKGGLVTAAAAVVVVVIIAAAEFDPPLNCRARPVSTGAVAVPVDARDCKGAGTTEEIGCDGVTSVCDRRM